MRGNMVLTPDFIEFVKSLNDNQVQYLIIGGYAVAFHGHPRYTKDLDVWINPDSDNAEKVVQALADFGFESIGLSADDFSQPDVTIQLGYPPNRIDLLTTANGLQFDQCFPKKQILEIDNTEVAFIDLENLKENKRATGRHQDLADLEKLD
ncbi:MAG: nucleotidyltransferase [Anaerolineae bacterium]